MKHIVHILDEACTEIAMVKNIDDQQKEDLIDLIGEIQNKIEELYLGGESDDED